MVGSNILLTRRTDLPVGGHWNTPSIERVPIIKQVMVGNPRFLSPMWAARMVPPFRGVFYVTRGKRVGRSHCWSVPCILRGVMQGVVGWSIKQTIVVM